MRKDCPKCHTVNGMRLVSEIATSCTLNIAESAEPFITHYKCWNCAKTEYIQPLAKVTNIKNSTQAEMMPVGVNWEINAACAKSLEQNFDQIVFLRSVFVGWKTIVKTLGIVGSHNTVVKNFRKICAERGIEYQYVSKEAVRCAGKNAAGVNCRV